MHWQSDLPTDRQYLPPTMSSLKYKTFRLHFIIMVLRSSHSHHNVFHLLRNSWEFSDSLLVQKS